MPLISSQVYIHVLQDSPGYFFFILDSGTTFVARRVSHFVQGE